MLALQAPCFPFAFLRQLYFLSNIFRRLASIFLLILAVSAASFSIDRRASCSNVIVYSAARSGEKNFSSAAFCIAASNPNFRQTAVFLRRYFPPNTRASVTIRGSAFWAIRSIICFLVMPTAARRRRVGPVAEAVFPLIGSPSRLFGIFSSGMDTPLIRSFLNPSQIKKRLKSQYGPQ